MSTSVTVDPSLAESGNQVSLEPSESETPMTLAQELCFKTIDAITRRFPELKEIRPGGKPFRGLSTAANPEAGAVRIWNGDRIARMVYIGLRSELPRHDGVTGTMLVDSHMVFAFTPKESAIPHFTLDSVHAANYLAFHLDLIPRVDLGANLAYMDAVYGGLVTDAQAETKKAEGFSPAQLSSRQLAVMSPWMLANRATPEAFGKIPVMIYLDQWSRLIENGLPAAATEGLTATDLARRDAQNRSVLFNKIVDPVWVQIETMIGQDVGEELRVLLCRQDRDI